jgi:uncharacterized protein YdaU (DUF1376 family)
MAKPPAFQFYPRDFVSDINVATMTLEERGMYITLLSYCWMENGIEYDPERLARLCLVSEEGFTRLWERSVRKCFRLRDGRWHNPRLSAERDKQIAYLEKQKVAGRNGSRTRWQNDNEELNSKPMILPMGFDSSASASASAKKRSTKNTALDKHRDVCVRLWDFQESLRMKYIPGSRALVGNDERLTRVAERLEAGHTEQDCQHVLRVYAEEATKGPESARWFNGETNWRPDNFDRAMGRTLTPAYTPTHAAPKREEPKDLINPEEALALVEALKRKAIHRNE